MPIFESLACRHGWLGVSCLEAFRSRQTNPVIGDKPRNNLYVSTPSTLRTLWTPIGKTNNSADEVETKLIINYLSMFTSGRCHCARRLSNQNENTGSLNLCLQHPNATPPIPSDAFYHLFPLKPKLLHLVFAIPVPPVYWHWDPGRILWLCSILEFVFSSSSLSHHWYTLFCSIIFSRE